MEQIYRFVPVHGIVKAEKNEKVINKSNHLYLYHYIILLIIGELNSWPSIPLWYHTTLFSFILFVGNTQWPTVTRNDRGIACGILCTGISFKWNIILSISFLNLKTFRNEFVKLYWIDNIISAHYRE